MTPPNDPTGPGTPVVSVEPEPEESEPETDVTELPAPKRPATRQLRPAARHAEKGNGNVPLNCWRQIRS